jgi:hypothetical protein
VIASLDGFSATDIDCRLKPPLQSVPPETYITAISDPAPWAWIAHQRAVTARHGRTEMPAYWMAEAQGFTPDHHADHWLRAPSEIDAKEAGVPQI